VIFAKNSRLWALLLWLLALTARCQQDQRTPWVGAGLLGLGCEEVGLPVWLAWPFELEGVILYGEKIVGFIKLQVRTCAAGRRP